MNIHEYQAKALLKDYGAPVSEGRAVFEADKAEAAAAELPGPLYVVKAQIHAGGRGKGTFKEAEAGEKGGVRLAKSPAEAAEFAKQMLGATLVTKQTGEAGKQVNRIYIENGSDIETELYLSALVDRGTGRIAFIASTRSFRTRQRCLKGVPWFSISSAFQPPPMPKRKRPPESRSSVATSLASVIGSRSTTRQMPVPIFKRSVTAAAAISDTNGSAMW